MDKIKDYQIQLDGIKIEFDEVKNQNGIDNQTMQKADSKIMKNQREIHKIIDEYLYFSFDEKIKQKQQEIHYIL